MATAAQIRSAVARAAKEALQQQPADVERRAVHFISFLAGWLHDDAAISNELRKVVELAQLPTDGA